MSPCAPKEKTGSRNSFSFNSILLKSYFTHVSEKFNFSFYSNSANKHTDTV